MSDLRRHTWVLGVLGAGFAVAFAVRTALRGVVDDRSWAFALSGAVLLLIWSWLDGADDEEERGWRRAGGSGGLLLLAVLGAGVLVEGVRRVDLIVDVARSAPAALAPATLDRLRALDQDVTITAVFRDGSPLQHAMRRRLSAFDAASPRLHIDWLDPLREPLRAEQLGATRESGELLLSAGSRRQRVVGRLDEGAIEDALVRLLSPRPRTLCWPRAHGEPDPDDLQDPAGFGEAVLALEGRDWTVQPVDLTLEVPEDCDVIAIVAPRVSLAPEEQAHVAAAVARGAGLVGLMEPGVDPGLSDVLAERGIQLDDGIAMASDGSGIRMGSDDPALLVLGPTPVDRPHPLTRRLGGPLVLALARPLRVAPPAVPALVLPESAGVMPLTPGADPDRVGEDLVLGALADGASRVAIVGDAGFASNRGLAVGSHRALWLDLVGWVGGDEVGLGNKAAGPVETLVLTRAQGTTLALLALVAMPSLWGLVGVAVWWRRRRL